MLYYLSGEFILKRYPNGGTVVMFRSLWITIIIYFFAIGIRSRLAPHAIWTPSVASAANLIGSTIPWFGAIFAGVYAALYARFASQWNYLANLYNQIMCAQLQCDTSGTINQDAMDLWQAGFIEDAETLHLALKPMFASVIQSMLTSDSVRDAYEECTPGGNARLEALEAAVNAVVSKTAQRYAVQTSSDTRSTSFKRTRRESRAA